MNTVKIKTTGTHCNSCAMLIELSVRDLEGVTEARASHAAGIAEVTYDPNVLDVETILATIQEAGYGAEVTA